LIRIKNTFSTRFGLSILPNQFMDPKKKRLSTNILQNILDIYGKPKYLIKFELIDDSKKETLSEKRISELSLQVKEFYQVWKHFVHDTYKTGNSCGVCLSCYTFVKKGPKKVNNLKKKNTDKLTNE
jgi:hypothetical protein